MRIVFMTMFEPEQGGGCSRVAHELARQFSTAHDTAIICGAAETGIRREGNLLMLGIQCVGKGNARVPLLNRANVAIVVDFMQAFEPEVIHAHDPILLAQLGQIYAQRHGIPFVYTAHVLSRNALEFGAAELGAAIDTPLAESVVRRFLKDFYRNCDGIVALNAPARADLNAFAKVGRIHVIPNGRFLAQYNACPTPDISSDIKTLTFVGYISERKNQVFLLDALTHLDGSYHLELVGEPMTPEIGAAFQARIGELGLTDRVHLVGKVRPEEVAGCLSRAHLFVSASKVEVQSLAVIEALASATPIVGLGNETIDELVSDPVGRRLPPTASPAAFAQAVRDCLACDQTRYQSLCDAARASVQAMDWGVVMLKTVALYEELTTAKTESHRLKRAPHLIPGLEGRLRPEFEQKLAQREQKSYERAVRAVKTVRLPWVIAGATMAATVGIKAAMAVKDRIRIRT